MSEPARRVNTVPDAVLRRAVMHLINGECRHFFRGA